MSHNNDNVWQNVALKNEIGSNKSKILAQKKYKSTTATNSTVRWPNWGRRVRTQEALPKLCVKIFLSNWHKLGLHTYPILPAQIFLWLWKWPSKLKSHFFRGLFSRLTFQVRQGPCLFWNVFPSFHSTLAINQNVQKHLCHWRNIGLDFHPASMMKTWRHMRICHHLSKCSLYFWIFFSRV